MPLQVAGGFAPVFPLFLRIFSILSPAFFTITFETFSAPFSATFLPTCFAKFYQRLFKNFSNLEKRVSYNSCSFVLVKKSPFLWGDKILSIRRCGS